MLGGAGPFVINLSSSIVPVSLPNNGVSVAANTRVYQIRCVEDRNVRYRLRLGPFVTEAQANAVLAVVRDNYPAALTATAIPSDLEAFADLQFEAVSAASGHSVPPRESGSCQRSRRRACSAVDGRNYFLAGAEGDVRRTDPGACTRPLPWPTDDRSAPANVASCIGPC